MRQMTEKHDRSNMLDSSVWSFHSTDVDGTKERMEDAWTDDGTENRTEDGTKDDDLYQSVYPNQTRDKNQFYLTI